MKNSNANPTESPPPNPAKVNIIGGNAFFFSCKKKRPRRHLPHPSSPPRSCGTAPPPCRRRSSQSQTPSPQSRTAELIGNLTVSITLSGLTIFFLGSHRVPICEHGSLTTKPNSLLLTPLSSTAISPSRSFAMFLRTASRTTHVLFFDTRFRLADLRFTSTSNI